MDQHGTTSSRVSAPAPARIGPYCPSEDRPNLYCMTGDEPLMFDPASRLNPRQREHWSFMQRDVSTYAMAVLAGTKAGDRVLLDRQFSTTSSLFEWYQESYEEAGLGPLATVEFVDPDDIYPRAASSSGEATRVSICFSHALAEAVELGEHLEISRRINSKGQLPQLAQTYGFATPRTWVTRLGPLRGEGGARRLDALDEPLVAKVDGLGGGSNVRMIAGHEDLLSFLEPYDDQTMVVLQQRLDRSEYTEYIADFVIREADVELSNVRVKLTLGNQWLGNLYSPQVTLDDAQRRNLERAAEALRAEGYRSPEGYVCGFDFFQNDRRQFITEINGRWTAGYPIKRLLDRLSLADRHVAIAHYDELLLDHVPAFRRFVRRHLVRRGQDVCPPGSFGVFPVSFCPWVESGTLTVWNLVVGDYTAYREAVVAALGSAALSSSRDVAAMLTQFGLLDRYGVGPTAAARRPR